jgi:cytoskeleton protein RodZ
MARRPKKSDEVNAEALEAALPLTQKPNLDTESDNLGLDESTLVSASQEQHSQCGGVLRLTRLAQGLSVMDIAKQLRLGNKQIEALEQDRFSDLPEATIVKGFIRNYAKLLKISAEPLLAAYAELMPEKEKYSFTLSPGINMKMTGNHKSNTTRNFILAIGLLLGVGVWFLYQNYVQKPNPINPIPEVIESLPELALPRSERIGDVSQTQMEMPEQPEEQAGIEQSESSVKIETDIGQSEVVVDEEVSPSVAQTVADVTPATSPATGKTRLEFSANQETWLSVVNISGEEVYNKILYAGNRDVIDIFQPSEIVVGNAHGATLVVDGKSIDLAPYTRINVARVRLNKQTPNQ